MCPHYSNMKSASPAGLERGGGEGEGGKSDDCSDVSCRCSGNKLV